MSDYIIIDKVVDWQRDYYPIGIEISMGDKTYFIAGRQDLWPGIRQGKFPPPSDINNKFLRIGLLALEATGLDAARSFNETSQDDGT